MLHTHASFKLLTNLEHGWGKATSEGPGASGYDPVVVTNRSGGLQTGEQCRELQQAAIDGVSLVSALPACHRMPGADVFDCITA
jgi:hypothetical protein